MPGLISSTTTKSQWPFSPQCIGGLNMWLDGSDTSTMFTDLGATTPVTANGQSIKAWKDKSKNGYLFTALNTGTSPDGPTYTTPGLNGLGVTSWSGTQILQSSTTFPFYTDASSGGSFFGVFNPSSTDSQRFLMYYQNQSNALICGSDTEFGYGINNAGTIGLHQGCGNATLTTGGSLSAGNNTIISYILGTSGTTPDNSLIYINSTQYTSTKFGTGFYSAGYYPFANNAQKLNIGGRYIQYDIPPANPDVMHLGTIAELLWFNMPVSDVQRIQIEGYLAAKWGLQANLPSTHTYKSAVPYNRSFRPIDITGCTLWLDGADSTTVSSTTWNDKSGYSYNFTPASGTISTNSLGVILSGSSYNIINTSIPVPSNYSIFIVAYPTSANASGYSRLVNIGSNSFGYVGSLNNAFASFTGNGGSSFFDINANTPVIVFNYGQLYVMKMIVNSVTLSSSLNGTALNNKTNSAATASTTGMSLGYDGQNWTGGVAEVILYNVALPMSQQLQIESYLGQKWGLASSLSAGHPGRLLPSFSSIFTPKSIPQLAMWFDAADISTFVLASNVITQWNDKSGNGYNLSNINGSPSNPTYANNQVNLISNGQYLVNNTDFGSPTSIAFSIFIVATMTNAKTLLSWGNPDANGLIPRWEDNTLYLGIGSAPSGVNWTVIGSPITLGIKYIYSIIYTGYTGTNNLWIDGINRINVATGGPLYRNRFQLGARSSFGDYMAGNINEVLYYDNSSMQLPQRQQIEGYLAWKWGLQGNLPASHTYAKFAP